VLGDCGAIRRRGSECENSAIGHKIRP
jgi:hypothetical protein